MINTEQFINEVLRYTFGSNSRLISSGKIKEGLSSNTFKVQCNQHTIPLFLKIEKNIELPRTHKYQIRREVSGIKLCRSNGIAVPSIISSDEFGKLIDSPWILEEFIFGEPISLSKLTNKNRILIDQEFDQLFTRLTSIESDIYGDTFPDGIIGQHNSWFETISIITSILFADCEKMAIFDPATLMHVKMALDKALSKLKTSSKPTFFHYDLLSGNIFSREEGGNIHVGCLIDFGMSLFAPIHYVYQQTIKWTDFNMTKIEELEQLGADPDELLAYDILKFEPVLLIHKMMQNAEQTLSFPYVVQYIDKCREFCGNI